MDASLTEELKSNGLTFKRSLDRIIDKYSKFQYLDAGREVDLNNTKSSTIHHFMQLSKIELNKLESKSLTDNSLSAQDITSVSQLDLTHLDGGADDSCVSSVSSTNFSVADDGMATTELTLSSLDESQKTLSEIELQPEDQDEELEMSLKSHGSSLVELYPSMISRIERAWHRQHVSEAADSVLRRYRKWRQQPNRSHLSNTFIVTLRHNKPKKKEESPVKIQFMGTDATPRSPMQMVTNMHNRQAQQQSPGRARGSLSRERPLLVMDMSRSSELNQNKPKEVSLNETFNVSQQEEQRTTYAVSPSRRHYPDTKACLDLSLWSKRLSVVTHSPQADGCSMYAPQTTAVKERPDIYSSPVRQSPLKARMMGSLSRSPHALSRSPKASCVESFSKERTRPRSMSTSLSSPPQKPTVLLRMLYPQDSHNSLQSWLPSPQSAKAAPGCHKLRRHLSFDSSLPSARPSYSLKELDEDFIKFYHKFVCQNKSSYFNRLPCRFCAQSSEASRGHSSSDLAALALSPHRSLLRKRHRELSLDSPHNSKRSRDEHCASSPGSRRYDLLRRCRSVSEWEQSHDGLSYSPSKRSIFSVPQRSADKHQGSRGLGASAAELFGRR